MNPNPYHPPQTDPALRPEPLVLAQLVGEDGGMSVDCMIELEDVIAFAIYHNTRSLWGRKQFLKRWLLIGLAILLNLIELFLRKGAREYFTKGGGAAQSTSLNPVEAS